jgi:NADPH-dependent 2,4-dienoyl-CoA reductase/sulfur reductase-like enzyme
MEVPMAVSGRKRILVLGGGFAGMFAARELRRRVVRVADIELINEVNYFTFQPLLPEVAAGGISVRDAVAPLRRLLPGVRVRQAQIYAIDLSGRSSRSSRGCSGATPRSATTTWCSRSARPSTSRASPASPRMR